MNVRTKSTSKKVVISSGGAGRKFRMTDKEYTEIIVGKDATGSEYVISGGIIEAGGFVPDHYHKWEDQTFHILQGDIEARIGTTTVIIGAGDTIHCPRGVSHYLKNIGSTDARVISYIFPGDWAEDFFEETSRQVQSQEFDPGLIEQRFGVVYL